MSQPSMSIEAAFETLRLAIESSLEATWKTVNDAVDSKSPDRAQQALDRVRSLDQLLHQLAVFRSDFEECVGLSIETTNFVGGHSSGHGFVKYGSRRSRRRGLDITPREEYYRPILEALVEYHGRAKAATVLDRVGEKMQHRFTEDDRALLPEGGSIRWRNHAQWVRLEMVKEGLLRRGSPAGIWEITDEGRAWLEKHH